MQIISGTTEFSIDEPSAVTLGKFDGLHQGHQLLLSRVLEKKSEGLKSLVFAFDFGDRPMLLLPPGRREILKKQGMDYLVECPFCDEISHMEAEYFVREVLVNRLKVRYMAVGTDFRFGYQRKGDYHLLQEMSAQCGYEIDVVEKAAYHGREISSTWIREELEKGDIELVNQLLGYAFTVSGEVVYGRQIGRKLGLPTVNLIPEDNQLLPPDGVYATRVTVGDETYEGVTNVGLRPTVGDENRRDIETYLFELDRDLYSETVSVHFYGHERPEEKYSTLGDLKAQIERDVDWGRGYFGEH